MDYSNLTAAQIVASPNQAPSYLNKKGKFILPELSPNCFGLAVPYVLTTEDIAGMNKGSQGIPATNYNGEILKAGDSIDAAVYTVSNKPYAKYRKVTKPVNSRKYDTCTLPRKTSGKPGSEERIAALAAYYENEDGQNSPFSCDMATLVSRSAIGKIFEDYSPNDGKRLKDMTPEERENEAREVA